MEKTTRRYVPAGWGQDDVTQYLDICRTNHLATFAIKRAEITDLTTIDRLFRRLLDGAINPKPLPPIDFLYRAHSAFLSATGAVMAGQVYEAQALLRICLEQGGYSHYIGADEKRWKIWGARDTDSKTKQEVRNLFTHRKISAGITTATPNLGKIYKELYERVIDYGAHPNPRGADLSSNIDDNADGGRRHTVTYLHSDGLLLDFGLKTTAQVGICVLRIAQVIYPTRMQATNIQYELEDISKRY